MFVRWKRKRRKETWDREGSSPPYTLSAVLVESRRVDGRPRQRFVKRLGSLWEGRIDGPDRGWWRAVFWRDVDKNLDALGLDVETRARLEIQVTRRVPRPTEEDRERARVALAQAEARISAGAQGNHTR
jgi:hypothetical protein